MARAAKPSKGSRSPKRKGSASRTSGRSVTATQKGPPKIRPRGLDDYFEVLTRAVFQSRMPWRVIEAKWERFRKAFRGFQPTRVARLTTRDVERLMADPGIVRNRRKIEATIENAHTMLALDKEYGGFKRFLRSHEDFEATSAALVKHFKFLGDLGAYYFLWVVSEPVPPYEQWCRSRGIKPRAMGSDP